MLVQPFESQLIVARHVAVTHFLLGEVETAAAEDVPKVVHGAVAPFGEEKLTCTYGKVKGTDSTYLSQ